MKAIDRAAQRWALFCLVAAVLQVVLVKAPGDAWPLPPQTSLVAVHLLLELVSVVVSVLIAAVCWHTGEMRTGTRSYLFVVGFLIVALCDLLHALAYDGMPRFVGAGSTQRAIYFWLAGRSVEAATLGIFALGWQLSVHRGVALALAAAGGAAIVVLGYGGLDLLPATFDPRIGVTPFKRDFEYALCAVNLGIAAVLWQRGRRQEDARLILMAASSFVIGVGEIAFAVYHQPSDVQNVLGHLYKLAGYGLLYAATVRYDLRLPVLALRESERLSRESEARIRALSDNLPNCVVYEVVPGSGGLALGYISEGVERVTGRSMAAVREDPAILARSVDPEDRPGLEAAVAQALRTRKPLDVFFRMRHPDEGERWMHLVAAPRRPEAADGPWDAVQLDVTAVRRADLQQRENAARYGAIIDAASDAIVSAGTDGRITLFNPAAERIFGRRAADMLGKPLELLLPAAARESHFELLRHFAKAHDRPRTMGIGRVQGLGADGELIELESSISVATVNGRQVLTANLRDVTQKSRAERALQRYRQELSELNQKLIEQERTTTRRIAQMLHDELGQTLTALRIEFVEEAQFDSPVLAARHSRANRLIDQAVREVRQVLVELRPTVLDEQGLVDAINSELRQRQPLDRDTELQLEVLEDLFAVRWEPHIEYAFFMVAREAIANAMLHARARRVTVSVEGDAARLCLTVADDGRGFAVQEHAAAPGHLGLVGMRERALAVGGRLEIRSEPGSGTTVEMRWEQGAR